MIYEKLPLIFDIEKLKEYYHETVIKFPPVVQGVQGNSVWQAWAITSENGDYQDGCITNDFVQKTLPNGEVMLDKEKTKGYRAPQVHVNYTQVGTGYVREIIEQIKAYGLNPCRARWAGLVAGKSTLWHRDEEDQNYRVFLHIPVITHSSCLFETKEGSVHLPADGSGYLLAVNRMHRGVNPSDQDKIHVMMDIVDNSGVTKHHAVPSMINI